MMRNTLFYSARVIPTIPAIPTGRLPKSFGEILWQAAEDLGSFCRQSAKTVCHKPTPLYLE